MFNPQRHRFFGGSEATHILVSTVNLNSSCKICLRPRIEHTQQRDQGSRLNNASYVPLGSYVKGLSEKAKQRWGGEKQKCCDICYEEQPSDQFFGLYCGHLFCKICLSEHLETNIMNGQVVKIPCMQHGCQVEFAEADVKAFGSEEIFKKYIRFKLNINVDMDPNLRWCPKNGCLNYVRKNGMF